MEASAKTGFNTKNIFLKAAEILYDEHLYYLQKTNENNENEDIKEKITFDNFKNKNKKEKGCCLSNL